MDRRQALRFLAASPLAAAWPARSQAPSIHTRPIPAGGERMPVVGLGTWLTFDVGGGATAERHVRGDVLRAFLAAGGRLVDSSPMYGSSEEVIGAELAGHAPASLFSATKVWTIGGVAGRKQMQHSLALWRLPRLDLMQIHNLLDWETHLPTLKAWKAEGRFRYIGMTTSHGRRHDDLEAILRRERLDFVQFTYNLADRSVEKVLLPLAAERGAAVIVNRPFDGGDLFARAHAPLPGWARELQCATWAEAFLKWIVAHPAVTCAIPATSKPAHLGENVRALVGPLPDEALRQRIAADYARL
ncbi:MAG TPA: aldo/keto reductase [Usitatibacter sp.]|jgi:diketogulonate reductase-like aldo/keto reductase|nr:aldo/keto reductase [Usitatibacter sp.]